MGIETAPYMRWPLVYNCQTAIVFAVMSGIASPGKPCSFFAETFSADGLFTFLHLTGTTSCSSEPVHVTG